MEEQRDRLPQSVLEASHQVDALRYGENGHQAAALYVDHDAPEGHTTLVTARGGWKSDVLQQLQRR